MFKRSEPLLSFLEGEIVNVKTTRQNSKIRALRLILSRLQSGENAGRIGYLLEGVMPRSDGMMLMAVDRALDKALADIERGFKVLKSEIEIAPVFHRLPERIKAHASLCFMALIIYRVMRQRLKLAGSELSPEAALDQLRRIQLHSISINSAAPISGISAIHQDQAAIFSALKTNKPSSNPQLSLL